MLEERDFQSPCNYDGTSFYGWNVDGLSEHRIINLLQQMLMAVNAYKLRNKNSDHSAANALVIEFTGLLKGWWDHYLILNDTEYKLEAKKIIIKDENSKIMFILWL